MGLFLRSGLAPRDRNRYESAVDGRFNFSDPFARVEGDAIVAGIVFARVSDHIRQAEEQTDKLPVSDYEMVLEVTCQFSATSWWTVQPNIQWIYHPGSSGALSDALVLSIRSKLSF